MRPAPFSAQQLDALRFAAHPLHATKDDHDALLELIADARFVLLGDDLFAADALIGARVPCRG